MNNNILIWNLNNNWFINSIPSIKAFLLNWNYNYYNSQIAYDANSIELKHNGIVYNVIELNVITPKVKKVALSFRSYNQINVVLVKGIY